MCLFGTLQKDFPKSKSSVALSLKLKNSHEAAYKRIKGKEATGDTLPLCSFIICVIKICLNADCPPHSSSLSFLSQTPHTMQLFRQPQCNILEWESWCVKLTGGIHCHQWYFTICSSKLDSPFVITGINSCRCIISHLVLTPLEIFHQFQSSELLSSLSLLLIWISPSSAVVEEQEAGTETLIKQMKLIIVLVICQSNDINVRLLSFFFYTWIVWLQFRLEWGTPLFHILHTRLF